jgi:hypothetical protein
MWRGGQCNRRGVAAGGTAEPRQVADQVGGVLTGDDLMVPEKTLRDISDGVNLAIAIVNDSISMCFPFLNYVHSSMFVKLAYF